MHRDVRTVTSCIIAKACSSYNNLNTFRHPTLTHDELENGTRLGLNSWADTSCAGKHAYVEAFIEGKLITASGFSPSMGKLNYLYMAHVVYAYDLNDGSTLLLENRNAIYMGENMNDSLLNPIQCEENDVRIDLRPAKFYGNHDSKCQKLIFDDGYEIPIEYDGVLPYLPVRKPTPFELDQCERRQLTGDYDWSPTNFVTSSISNE